MRRSGACAGAKEAHFWWSGLMLLPYVREKFKPCPLFPHTADTIVKLSQRLMYTCVSSQSTQLSSCSCLRSEGKRIWLMDVNTRSAHA